MQRFDRSVLFMGLVWNRGTWSETSVSQWSKQQTVFNQTCASFPFIRVMCLFVCGIVWLNVQDDCTAKKQFASNIRQVWWQVRVRKRTFDFHNPCYQIWDRQRLLVVFEVGQCKIPDVYIFTKQNLLLTPALLESENLHLCLDWNQVWYCTYI